MNFPVETIPPESRFASTTHDDNPAGRPFGVNTAHWVDSKTGTHVVDETDGPNSDGLDESVWPIRGGSGKCWLFDFPAKHVDWINPGIVIVRVFHMQLSNVAFDREQGHDQMSNSNRLARDKFNLVELHDWEIPLKKTTPFQHAVLDQR